ncbi:hypothetical protein DESPIG_01376 [Desulfovibrio piger ATCC 29098]|uniref:Uncharacterized protein n=1 Tax=Desulfovibrio piger ATCC 29098 TaxID=411464 RepID=B6WTH0_9BACT|nr:hypothetical protein DESPIG_01376 [Desulfovibrio piger ATCC 29098]
MIINLINKSKHFFHFPEKNYRAACDLHSAKSIKKQAYLY